MFSTVVSTGFVSTKLVSPEFVSTTSLPDAPLRTTVGLRRSGEDAPAR